MSGRCMSSRIRCGRRARIGRQAVEAGHRDLHLHLRRAAPGCRASPRRWSRCPRCSARSAGGSRPARSRGASRSDGHRVRVDRAAAAQDERRAFAGDAAARRSEPPISSARRRLMTRPMPVPSSRRALAAEPVERLEQLVHLLRRHAHAGVGDRDLDARRRRPARLATWTRPPSMLYLTALLSRLVRICLTRVASPTMRRGASAPSSWLIRMPRCGGVAGDQRRPSPRTSSRQVERRRLQAQVAGLDARQVEHVVDHLQQVPAGLLDLRRPRAAAPRRADGAGRAPAAGRSRASR